jgi:hypothetical protein
MATLAEDSVLDLYKIEKIACGEGTEMIYNGWSFKSFHQKICSSIELDMLLRNLESKVEGLSLRNIRLPPMLFLNDVMKICNIDNDISLAIKADDALEVWAQQHNMESLNIVQVSYSKQWRERSFGKKNESADFEDKDNGDVDSSHKWDWTFTSDYICTLERLNKCHVEIIAASKLSCQSSLKEQPSSVFDVNEEKTKWHWIQATKSGLEMDVLADTRSPILFFDEITLYQVNLAFKQDDIFLKGNFLYVQ